MSPLRMVVALILLASGITIGVALTDQVRETTQVGAQSPAIAQPITTPGGTLATSLPDFSRVAERRSPPS